jgi:hypothetical protein
MGYDWCNIPCNWKMALGFRALPSASVFCHEFLSFSFHCAKLVVVYFVAS